MTAPIIGIETLIIIICKCVYDKKEDREECMEV